MYHLRLVKGKTYWGIVKASEEKPDVFVQEKEKAPPCENGVLFHGRRRN